MCVRKVVPKVVPPLFGSPWSCRHVDVHLHDAPGHTSSTSRQHCNATLLEIDTVASCRSKCQAKWIEMAQFYETFIIYSYKYIYSTSTAALIGFPGFSAPLERENEDTTAIITIIYVICGPGQSSASQGSKKFSTTCQALGTCRTYENFDQSSKSSKSSRFDRFAQ